MIDRRQFAAGLAGTAVLAAPLVANARVSGMSAYQALVDEANRDHEGYWGRLAREFVSWKKPFTQVLDRVSATMAAKQIDLFMISPQNRC